MVKDSGTSFSLMTPRPVMDRLTPEMQLTLTMVPRWICQKISGQDSAADGDSDALGNNEVDDKAFSIVEEGQKQGDNGVKQGGQQE